MFSRRFPPPPIGLSFSLSLPLRWGLPSDRAPIPGQASLGVILLNVFLKVPLSDQLLYLIPERVAFLCGLAYRPMVLAVWPVAGVNCVLNLAFRVAKESMLLADNSENHSNASPVNEVENTRH